jgi:hypothetical protein
MTVEMKGFNLASQNLMQKTKDFSWPPRQKFGVVCGVCAGECSFSPQIGWREKTFPLGGTQPDSPLGSVFHQEINMSARQTQSAANANVTISPAHGVQTVSGLDEEMKITMLGAGQEVGRSCCVIEYKSTTVVCDTGIHPAFSGMAALPFIDEVGTSAFILYLLET